MFETLKVAVVKDVSFLFECIFLFLMNRKCAICPIVKATGKVWSKQIRDEQMPRERTNVIR